MGFTFPFRPPDARGTSASPSPSVPLTGEVLAFLVPHKDLCGDMIDSAVTTLLDAQAPDGGWPVTIGLIASPQLDSSPLASARAIYALATALQVRSNAHLDSA